MGPWNRSMSRLRGNPTPFQARLSGAVLLRRLLLLYMENQRDIRQMSAGSHGLGTVSSPREHCLPSFLAVNLIHAELIHIAHIAVLRRRA